MATSDARLTGGCLIEMMHGGEMRLLSMRRVVKKAGQGLRRKTLELCQVLTGHLAKA